MNITTPTINAANLSSEELKTWLETVIKGATQVASGNLPIKPYLKSAEDSLRYAIRDLESTVSFLGSDQIIRSEGQTIAIQAELNSQKIVLAALQHCHQTIQSCLEQLHRNHGPHRDEALQDEVKAIAEPRLVEGAAGQERLALNGYKSGLSWRL